MTTKEAETTNPVRTEVETIEEMTMETEEEEIEEETTEEAETEEVEKEDVDPEAYASTGKKAHVPEVITAGLLMKNLKKEIKAAETIEEETIVEEEAIEEEVVDVTTEEATEEEDLVDVTSTKEKIVSCQLWPSTKESISQERISQRTK